MRKYKLSNKEQDKVSDEEASKYKDFGKVVGNYNRALDRVHKKPLYKDPKAFLFLVVLALITVLMVESGEPQDEANPSTPSSQDSTQTDSPE
jgi:hypothetical protein